MEGESQKAIVIAISRERERDRKTNRNRTARVERLRGNVERGGGEKKAKEKGLLAGD